MCWMLQYVENRRISLSDGAMQVFERGGVHENRTYRRPFTSAVHASLVVNPGALPSPAKN